MAPHAHQWPICLPLPLQDLAAGYMSGKLLLKLDAIAFLLTHHTSGEMHCQCVLAPSLLLLQSALLPSPPASSRASHPVRQPAWAPA